MYRKVYVEITNICNMNCSFCHGHSRPPRRMTEEEFALILDRLAGHTQYIYYHLMGEPLTHPLLPRFLEMARARGYKSILTTNGTLLHKRGGELLAAGLHKANLSLHSFEEDGEEAHARYVGVLADFAKSAALAGTISVFRLWNQGADGGKNEVALRYLKEHFPEPWEEHPRGVKLGERIFLEWGERFDWPDKEGEIRGDRFFCYGLKDHFGILSDGTVVPCCLDSDGVIALGNVFEQDLAAILSSPRAVAMVDCFRRGAAAEDLCRRCGYAQRFV